MKMHLIKMIILYATLLAYLNVCYGQPVCPPTPNPNKVFEHNKNRLIFYVDIENGNDGWSGTLLSPNRDANDGPFQTLDGAINRIRRFRKRNKKGAILYVRAGTYVITQKINLNKKDSRLHIIGYPTDTRPIISGAYKILGSQFKKITDKIWTASFKGRCSKHAFLGSRRLVRARKPNLITWSGNELSGQGPYLTIKDLLVSTPRCNREGTGGYKQDCPSENKDGFIFYDGDIDPTWLPNEKASTGEIIIFHAWTAERASIKAITKHNKVYFDQPLRKAIGTSPKPSGWRYIIENIKSELDTIGEFYCDEEQGKLYVIPPEGALHEEDVYISQTSTFFRGKKVATITFKNLDFRHSHDNGYQGTNPVPAMLEFISSEKIKIHRCSFTNAGHSAVGMKSSIQSEVKECHFEDIGYFGIVTQYKGNPNAPFATKDILIEKNTLKGCGVISMFQPSCIFVQGVRNIAVAQNDISVTPYSGIRAGWQQTFSLDFLPVGKYVFKITENNIHDYGQQILNDFGGIYLSSNRECGSAGRDANQCHLPSIISRNTIHDSKCYFYGAHGVYGDTGLSSLSIQYNWIYHMGSSDINFHCGQFNFAINNMIYHDNRHPVFGTCHSIGGHGYVPRQILSFSQNVIYVTNTEAHMYNKGDSWEKATPVVNYNNYYFSPFVDQSFSHFFPKYKSWHDWKETGNDEDSIVKDPRFINIQGGDFRLQWDSPALEIGILSVDLRRVLFNSGIC